MFSAQLQLLSSKPLTHLQHALEQRGYSLLPDLAVLPDLIHPEAELVLLALEIPESLELLEQRWQRPVLPLGASFRGSAELLPEVELCSLFTEIELGLQRWCLRQQEALPVPLSKQRYQIIAEQTGQVLYDWELASGKIRWAGAIEQITGFSQEHFQTVDIHRWEELIHPEDRVEALKALREAQDAATGRYSVTYRLRRKDLSYTYIEDNGVFVAQQHEPSQHMLGTMKDVSQQKTAARKLQQALNERSMLLQEMHHRVKNNFQLIMSLLSLQARQLNETDAQRYLLEAKDRIHTLALVHERLYCLQDGAEVDMRKYLGALVQDLNKSESQREITLRLDLEPVYLPMHQAILCGLLVNELLTNAFKYAFPPEHDHALRLIELSLKQQKQRVKLMMTDSGVGLPEIDPEAQPSLGLRLVYSLIQQLQAKHALRRERGTCWEVCFAL